LDIWYICSYESIIHIFITVVGSTLFFVYRLSDGLRFSKFIYSYFSCFTLNFINVRNIMKLLVKYNYYNIKKYKQIQLTRYG